MFTLSILTLFYQKSKTNKEIIDTQKLIFAIFKLLNLIWFVEYVNTYGNVRTKLYAYNLYVFTILRGARSRFFYMQIFTRYFCILNKCLMLMFLKRITDVDVQAIDAIINSVN